MNSTNFLEADSSVLDTKLRIVNVSLRRYSPKFKLNKSMKLLNNFEQHKSNIGSRIYCKPPPNLIVIFF